jgi:transcriptional regulator with XRE-family HTH domain
MIIFMGFLGQNLYSMREEARISGAELAMRLGKCEDSVSAIENGLPGVTESMGIEDVAHWQKACSVPLYVLCLLAIKLAVSQFRIA